MSKAFLISVLMLLLGLKFSLAQCNKSDYSAFFPLSNSITDNSTHSNLATLSGGVFINNSLLLGNNTTDFLSLPPHLLHQKTAFSISFSIHFTDFHVNRNSTLNTVISGDNATNTNAFGLSYQKTQNKWIVTFNNDFLEFTDTLQNNNWYCVTLTRNAANEVILYRDNLPKGQYTINSQINISSLLIGQETDCEGGCFQENQNMNGSIKTLKFYDCEVGEDLCELNTFFEINCFKRSTYTWYFGNKAGLKFDDNDNVTALTNGQANIVDNTSTFSDTSGNILLYSDGLNVWNKNHQIMQNGNGLLGNQSGGQPITIVPKPNDNKLFYLITTDAFGGSNGLRYSIVDISENNGLGRVVEKNTLLYTPSTEKVTITQNCNGIDFWIITHRWNSNEFVVYPLTESGIGTPIITAIGTTHTGGNPNTYNAMGQMKVAPDGKTLALGIYSDAKIEFFDFDNTNGTLSNYRVINNYPNIWGIEFSASGKYLYVSQWMYQPITQFDFSLGTISEIAASATVIGTSTGSSGYHAGYMQLAPNGKIYIARWQQDYLAVINNPELQGINCDFQNDGVYLGGKTSYAGLPQFPQSNLLKYPKPYLTGKTELCIGDTLEIILNNKTINSCAFYNNEWILPSNANIVFSSDTLLKLTFASNGIFKIKSKTTFSCYQNLDSLVINIKANSFNTIAMNACNTNNLVINANTNYSTFLWNTNETTDKITVLESGLYWVNYDTLSKCLNVDTFNVKIIEKISPHVLSDTSVCTESHNLNISNEYINVIWSNGTIGNNLSITNSGVYHVSFQDSDNCTFSDTVKINFNKIPSKFLASDTTICLGSKLEIKALFDFERYNWNTNENSKEIIVDAEGQYILEVTNKDLCLGKDTINISTVKCCIYFFVPNIFTPNNDGVNDFFEITCPELVNEIVIYNRWGQKVYFSENYLNNWNGENLPDGVYYYFLTFDSDNKVKKGFIEIIR
jgi:gliding motility-associated-like protein